MIINPSGHIMWFHKYACKEHTKAQKNYYYCPYLRAQDMTTKMFIALQNDDLSFYTIFFLYFQANKCVFNVNNDADIKKNIQLFIYYILLLLFWIHLS